MNLDYLQNVLLPQRELEFKEGKNSGTRNPLYIVYELVDNYCSGFNDFIMFTNSKDKDKEFGYIDMALEGEDREFCETDESMEDPHEVTKFYVDNFKALFLTRKSAEEYLLYQKHNLRNPYIYVESIGYRNYELEQLFEKE